VVDDLSANLELMEAVFQEQGIPLIWQRGLILRSISSKAIL
jgi:hypothetical protein